MPSRREKSSRRGSRNDSSSDDEDDVTGLRASLREMRNRRGGVRSVTVEVLVDGGEAPNLADGAHERCRSRSAPAAGRSHTLGFHAAAFAAAAPHAEASLRSAAGSSDHHGRHNGHDAQAPQRAVFQVRCAAGTTWKQLAMAAAQRFGQSSATGAGLAARGILFGPKSSGTALGGGPALVPITVSTAGAGRQDDFCDPDALVCSGDYGLDAVKVSLGLARGKIARSFCGVGNRVIESLDQAKALQSYRAAFAHAAPAPSFGSPAARAGRAGGQ